MRDDLVEIPDQYGQVALYRRYAARIPEFLTKYPIEAGFRVEVAVMDLLSLQPGRLALLKEAIAAGKKPSDVGLPGVERDINTMVFVAKLLNAQGQVVRSASASMMLDEHKDYEVLETAANQRLLAALGFGGQVFDRDEDRDFRAQGIPVGTGTASSMDDQPAPTSASLPTPQAASRWLTPEKSDAVPRGQQRQIENLARQLGEPAVELKGAEDADKELRRLGDLQAQRRRDATKTASAAR